jgi:alcohol dehydrogenase class IV
LRQRAPGNVTLQRYEEIARILIGSEQAPADDGVQWVGELARDLQVPRLGSYGIRSEHVAELVAKAAQSSSMKANPVLLSDEELAGALRQAL